MHGDVAIVTIRSHFYCFYLRVLRDVQIHSGFSRTLAKKCERHATRPERKPSKIRDEPVTRDLSPERKERGRNRARFQKSACLVVLGRIEKEKEDLKVDLRASRVEISGLRREIEESKQEEKRLRQAIQQADIDIGRRKKDIDNVMNERDILGTQLVRRNDELSLQYSRIKVRFFSLYLSLLIFRVRRFEIYVIQRAKLKFNI